MYQCRPLSPVSRRSKVSIWPSSTHTQRVLGRPPAEADLQKHFGVSPPSVHQMVLTLERAGLIRRQPGIARSIEVLVPPELLRSCADLSWTNSPNSGHLAGASGINVERDQK